MTAIKLLADADLNENIVRGLRRREPAIDLLDAHEGKIVGLSDPEVLEIAALTGRVLISHDCNTMPDHFARFLKKSDSPGLLIVSQSLGIGPAIEVVLSNWAVMDSDDIRNQLRFLRRS